ncbi:MAG: SAM-dependent methyltransferase [Longimicrobiales bacterium]
MNPWDERYGEEGWAFGTEPNDFLREQAHLIPEGRVLCLGEGEGRNSVFLAELGYEVVGVDRSQVGLDKAQALARERGVFVETVVTSIEDFDLREGEWEGIVSIFFHLPPDLRKKVHEAVVLGLAPGGVLILEAYTPRQLELGTGGPRDRDRLMTLETLAEELVGLETIVARETEREVLEGRMHHGPGSVVQFVGVRAGG